MEAIVVSIVNAIGSIASTENQRRTAYQNWLSQAVPQYTDVFGNYKSNQGKTNLNIIAILVGLIVVLIIAIAWKKS